MSASMYNTPYGVQKPPQPRIDYPPMFAKLTKMSFRHIFDSKFLALAAILLGIATLVVLLTIVNPFWFKLTLSSKDATFGSEPVMEKVTINTGLFYMDESQFDNLAFLNKYTNKDVIPKFLIYAQVCSVIATCLLICCLLGTIILVFRKLGSITATFVLAFFSSLAGIFQIQVFIFALLVSLFSNCEPGDQGCNYEDNLVWRSIPIYTQIYRIAAHITPYVAVNWALFISILGAILIIAAAVLLWLEALIVYRNVSKIRYQQLRTARDPHEKDINVTETNRKFIYQPPDQYGNMYGMRPVARVNAPYYDGGNNDVFLPPTAPQYGRPPNVGFRDFSDTDSEPRGRPPSPGFKNRPPPYESSSVSEHNISREINI